jgi:hypothetical protein
MLTAAPEDRRRHSTKERERERKRKRENTRR